MDLIIALWIIFTSEMVTPIMDTITNNWVILLGIIATIESAYLLIRMIQRNDGYSSYEEWKEDNNIDKILKKKGGEKIWI